MSTDRQRATRFETYPTIADGVQVVEKAATGASRSAIRREASVLAQMDSPWLVSFIELREDDTRTVLVTRDGGSRTLAASAKLTLLELRRSLVECVRAVNGLRAMGWEHRSLSPEHVIVGFRGRIRLCSMASASRLGNDIAARTSGNISAGDSVDVISLIELVSDVASQEQTEEQWGERLRRKSFTKALTGIAAAAKVLVAEGKSADDVLEHLERSLDSVTTARKLPKHGRLGPYSAKRIAGAGTAILAITVVAIGVSAARTTTVSEAAEPSAVSPPRAAAQGLRPAAGSRPEPNIVVVDGKIYSVGIPGDVTAVGNWHCSPTRTLILLRPSTGEVFTFDRWAADGEPAPGRLVAVEPAVNLRNENSACEEPLLEMSDGSHSVLARQTIEGF